METTNKTSITVESSVNAAVENVWEYWTKPEHITQWNNASDDWHTPRAENNLSVGGTFVSRMESKDGAIGFDFSGVYDEVNPYRNIAYTLGDGRKVNIRFSPEDNSTRVTENFEAENTNSLELQQAGWQAILDNFKKYAEEKG